MDTIEQAAIETMRTVADYFPNIKIRVIRGICYAASYLRIYQEGIWYKVFYVEMCEYNGRDAINYVLQNYIQGAYWFPFTYTVETNITEVDSLQIPERERLATVGMKVAGNKET